MSMGTGDGHQNKILRPSDRSYAGAVGPGFHLVKDYAQFPEARVCRHLLYDEDTDATDQFSRPDLTN